MGEDEYRVRQHTHTLNGNRRIGIRFFEGELSYDEIDTDVTIALDRARVLTALIPMSDVGREESLMEHGLTEGHIDDLVLMLREQLEIMDICRHEPCARGKQKSGKPKTHKGRKAKEVTELNKLWQKPDGDEPEEPAVKKPEA